MRKIAAASLACALLLGAFPAHATNCVPTNPTGATAGTAANAQLQVLEDACNYLRTQGGSAGTVGSAVPSLASLLGLNVAGTLRGASGLSTGSLFPLAVAIVDGSGNQITSFAGTDTRPSSGTITVQDTGSSTATGQNNSSIITGTPTASSFQSQAFNGQSSARILITGVWTGTLSFEGSLDSGTTWTTIPARVVGSSFTQGSVTSNGQFDTDIAGLTNVRVRATAAMTGTATVRFTITAASGVVQLLNPVRLFDNTSGAQATIKPASTAPQATDTAVVTTLRDAAAVTIADGADTTLGAKADAAAGTGTVTAMAILKQLHLDATAAIPAGTNLIGSVGFNQATQGTTNGVTNGAHTYATIAASQTTQVLGSTGAAGDYLSHCTVVPTSTSPGVVTIIDNATTIYGFPGGASSLSNLVPFTIPVGAISASGAWKVTTGANLSVTCVGKFT